MRKAQAEKATNLSLGRQKGWKKPRKRETDRQTSMETKKE